MRRRCVLLLLVGAIVMLLLLIKNVVLCQASFLINHLILIISAIELLILLSLLRCQKLRWFILALLIVIVKQRTVTDWAWAGLVVLLMLLDGVFAEQGLLRYHLVRSFGSFWRY